MKRMMLILLAAAVTFTTVSPAAAARRVTVRNGAHRTTVVVERGWPLRRPLPVVVTRPVRHAVVVRPRVFLAPVAWRATVISLPPRERIVWEDSERLTADEGWTELTLNVEDRGRQLDFEVVGRAQIDFAEIVFENGDTRVVDFNQRAQKSGSYRLLDFSDGRRVDHVRMVARARSDEAKITLLMEK